MTSRTEPATGTGGLHSVVRTSAGIAVSMAVMNVTTYGFQLVAARLLGPDEYGAVAGLMNLLMVVAVVQLGLQATAARRIAAAPAQVGQIEQVVLGVTYRCAIGVGVVLTLAAPVVAGLLRLESVAPALLLAAAAVPLTISGGQAGVLQGERRWRALGLLYLGVGVPRVVLGTACILVHPSPTSAMVGVALALVVPAVVGWAALRHDRPPGLTSPLNDKRLLGRETAASSLALLAFFLLSNLDMVVARGVLEGHEAGLYAGGLILTKAVLFLPQFVVVIAFPSMAADQGRRGALVRSLALALVLGLLCTAGALVLSGVATGFVGGAEYAEVQSRLWAFALLGTLLSVLQLLVYSVLARRGTWSAYLIWIAVLALATGSTSVGTLDDLVTLVLVVDAALFSALLAASLWRLRVTTA